jgi:hypothetical protein
MHMVWAQLVDEAHARWVAEEEGVVDDITAVVVHFKHPDVTACGGAGSASASSQG